MNITAADLAPLYKNSVGLDRFIENMVYRTSNVNTGNYPPYNIIQINKNNYCVEIALAGFSKDEISVQIENNMLVIVGSQSIKVTDRAPDGEQYDESAQVLHQGISAKSFTRTFALADHVEVKNAVSENGILRIALERNIPENLKPKKIDITFTK